MKALALAAPSLALPPLSQSPQDDSPTPTDPIARFLTYDRAAPAGSSVVRSLSLMAGSSYSGVVPLTAQFDLGAGVPSDVTISIGRSSRPMTRIRGTDTWEADPGTRGAS